MSRVASEESEGENRPLLGGAVQINDDRCADVSILLPAAEKKTHVVNIAVLSLGFLLLFTAYNSLQNYITSLLPGDLGNESLSVLYCSICVCVFVAPSMAKAIGERATMILGAACYVAYMASLAHIITWIVLLLSVVIGFGAAILWVAMGSFLMKCSAANEYGRNSGGNPLVMFLI